MNDAMGALAAETERFAGMRHAHAGAAKTTSIAEKRPQVLFARHCCMPEWRDSRAAKSADRAACPGLDGDSACPSHVTTSVKPRTDGGLGHLSTDRGGGG